MDEIKFAPWPKIPRLRRDMTITEKIDGTNAAVGIVEVPLDSSMPATLAALEEIGDRAYWVGAGITHPESYGLMGHLVYAQSRKRLITPKDDNYGFARWTWENANDLVTLLGAGLHFGEWWGQGIQRNYGLDHKRFSLFNTSRWGWLNQPEAREAKGVPDQLWSVPVLMQGTFGTYSVAGALDELDRLGSAAAPGFMKPEGVIVFHHAANAMFKVTLENDQNGKGE